MNMIISFSGPDGVGKTTQISYLMKYFSSIGLTCCSIYDISPSIRYHKRKDLLTYLRFFQPYDVIHTRFRMNSDANNEIVNELENNSVLPNKPLAMLAAQQGYADYCEWFNTVIYPLRAKREKIFIFDRYIWDEIAFKTFYGCSFKYMENLYADVERPQISLICTANVLTIKERNSSRPDGITTLYKSPIYIEQLNKLFAQISKMYDLQQISMEKTPTDTHRDILEIISPLISAKR